MPEYLAPGVYVEETSFRSKSIEGVSTSTAGFVGPTRFGPTSGTPELLTSLADFERTYGGMDDLVFSDGTTQTNYIAHAARAFFEEGGKRLYVMRVFDRAGAAPAGLHGHTNAAYASPPLTTINLRARFPGSAGNMRVTFYLRLGDNTFIRTPIRTPPGGTDLALNRVRDHDTVVVQPAIFLSSSPSPLPPYTLCVAHWDRINRQWRLRDGMGNDLALADLPLDAKVRPLTVRVEVERPDDASTGGFASPEPLGEFTFDRRGLNALSTTFMKNPPTRFAALTTPFALELDFPDTLGSDTQEDTFGLEIARELVDQVRLQTQQRGATPKDLTDDTVPLTQRRAVYTLTEGSDGKLPAVGTYEGDPIGFHDYQHLPLDLPKNGLLAFEALEDISIVAAPGYTAGFTADPDRAHAINTALLAHCERMRYRIAVLDTPPDQLVSGALEFRSQRESKYGALYYPWVMVADPRSGARLKLPPSGFVAGIYARNDIEHAVFKAPANETVRLAIDFEQRLNKAQQEVLNPEGVNCFRYFDGRGFLLWGARTISTDPEWKYVNLRRYFAYLEHSIDRGTQWAVFENNGPQLWVNVRQTIEDFLLNEWKMGGLLGDKPDKAYFVRCDRSTMTQNDLDNGRLVCLIGVAPVRPAEFVIFRIGQWTADATR